MTVRLLAFSGLHLDRAWPDESPDVAQQLRDVSAGLLLELGQRAFDLGVDGVVVLGGLWDTDTVRSSTVDDVRAVLGAIPVSVIVLPDDREAQAGFRPHNLAEWPATVHWVGAEATTQVEVGSGRLGVQGPRASAAPPAEGVLALLTTRADAPPTPVAVIGPADVAPLVPGSGGGRCAATVITLRDGESPQLERVELSSSAGTVRTLDVGEHADGASLTAALDDLLRSCDPLDRVEVSGRVGPRVLVPPALRWEPGRRDVTVLWRDLEHVFPEVPQDRTVQAELIRRLSGAGPDAHRRHQALAMGLASLDSEEVTA
ncbi:hypothetical protein ACI3ET_09755 [Ornithinimicrobium sp. LYQ121]|uniref:hypothetical protein n=1 Tax=Ornithinimicrobium sp. LYQ121 TaxID=3378801 RepID=UPI0038519430